jgi:hypothetical protein
MDNCESCIHTSVCMLSENFKKLQDDIKIMIVYSGYFSVSAKCSLKKNPENVFNCKLNE